MSSQPHTLLDASPRSGAPECPLGFVPLDRAQSRALLKPDPLQVAGAGSLLVELAGATTYADDFTENAPSADEMRALVGAAVAWTAEATAAENWQKYADAQRQLAWDAVLRRLAMLKKEYVYAREHDVTITGRYPALTGFVEAKQGAAMRAWQTKRAKGKVEAT